MSKEALFVPKEKKDRKIQQALLQPHKPQHREILQDYMRSKRRKERLDFGTCDSRTPQAILDRQKVQQKKIAMPTTVAGKLTNPENRQVKKTLEIAARKVVIEPRSKGKSLVEPPRGRLGRKLYLDSR